MTKLKTLNDFELLALYEKNVGGRALGSLSEYGKKVLAEVDRRANS